MTRYDDRSGSEELRLLSLVINEKRRLVMERDCTTLSTMKKLDNLGTICVWKFGNHILLPYSLIGHPEQKYSPILTIQSVIKPQCGSPVVDLSIV